MARFSDAQKNDPYRNFNFKILFGNIEVAACKKMSKLSVAVDVVKFRAGNAQSPASELLPGRVTYDPITLESGLTQDFAFQDWATMLARNEWSTGDRAVEPNFRRDVTVRMMDLDNKTVVREYVLHNAWVSKYQAVSDLVGDANDIAIESVEIQYEGFIRTDANT